MVADIAHLLQHGEFPRRKLVKLSVFDDKNVFIAVVFPQDRAAVARPFGQAAVNISKDRGFF